MVAVIVHVPTVNAMTSQEITSMVSYSEIVYLELNSTVFQQLTDVMGQPYLSAGAEGTLQEARNYYYEAAAHGEKEEWKQGIDKLEFAQLLITLSLSEEANFKRFVFGGISAAAVIIVLVVYILKRKT